MAKLTSATLRLVDMIAVMIVVLICSRGALASIDVYEFSSDDNRKQYLELTKELRCPKCQNQDIADSNAPIAKDMRREVHRMVEEGQSSESIVSFMVERFGDFVRYKPRVDQSTYALWYGPFVLLVLGVLVVYLLAIKNKRGKADSDTKINTAQHDAVKALLEENAKMNVTDRDTNDQSTDTDGKEKA